MKKALAIVLTTSFLVAGCAGAGKKEEMAAAPAMATPAITQAKSDLDAALAADGQWRIIDSATGSKAVDLKKLLKVAEDKAKEGDLDEANRIAARVSEAAKLGVEQSERYAGSAPYYN